MSRIPIIGFVLALSMSACVNNNGDDDDEMGSGSAIAPRQGQWGYAEKTPVTSNCPSNLPGEAGNFLIDQSSIAGFRVVPGDGTAPFNCTLNKSAFSCPNRAAAMQDYRPQFDAVVTVRATANGTFSSDIRATGRQDATVECVGVGCAAVPGAMFPCNFTVNFVIAAR